MTRDYIDRDDETERQQCDSARVTTELPTGVVLDTGTSVKAGRLTPSIEVRTERVESNGPIRFTLEAPEGAEAATAKALRKLADELSDETERQR